MSTSSNLEPTNAPVRSRDFVVALLWFAAALALYRGTWQRFMFDDGPTMAVYVSLELGLWYHVLLVPLAVAVKHALGVTDGQTPLLWVSSTAGAVAVGATFAFLRCMGVGRWASGAVAALLLVSPALWFQSTTTEVHALHAGVMALGALWVALLPWGRGRHGFSVSVVLAALAPAAAVLAHRSGLTTGAGWLALAWLVAAQRGVERPWWTWIAIVGPWFLAVALAANHWGAALLGGAPGVNAGGHAFGVWNVFLGAGSAVEQIVEDWVLAWPMLALLCVAAFFVRESTTRRAAAVLVAGALPPLAFAASVGLASEGGYGLAATPFIALAAATVLERVFAQRRTPYVVAGVFVALAVHATLAVREQHDPQRLASACIAQERLGEARALLPGGGFLLSADSTLQNISAWEPSIQELAIGRILPSQRTNASPIPESIPQLDAVVFANPGRFAWDPNWRETLDPESGLGDTSLIPLEAYFARTYRIEKRTAGKREYWLLLAPASPGS